MIDAVLAALTEDAYPRIHIGWRVTRQGEAAVLHRSAQEDGVTVHEQLSALNVYLAHAEGGLVRVVASFHGEAIDIGRELVPSLHAITHVEGEFHAALQGFLDAGPHAMRLRAVDGLRLYAYEIVHSRQQTQSLDVVLELHDNARLMVLDIGIDLDILDIELSGPRL